MMKTFTGIPFSLQVANSWAFIWIDPSPVIRQVGTSGTATAAPIAAGRPKPIVPRPPELIQRRGLAEWKYCALHIWGWPTSEARMDSPPVASDSAWAIYSGFVSLSEASDFSGVSARQ